MIAHFVNVLVPVNLHSTDDEAIEIAIQSADPRFCVIHLLDIVRPNILSFVFGGRAIGQEISGIGIHRFVKGMLYMNKLKTRIERYRPNSTIKVHICKSGNLPEVIVSYANRLSVQAIIIPEIEYKGDLSPEDIAGKTKCKVLGSVPF